MESGEVVRKGIKRRYKVIVGLVLVLVVLFVGLNLWRESELEKKYAQIRAEGFPVTLAELDAWYSIPAGEENAADKYVEAFSIFVKPKDPDPLLLFQKSYNETRTERLSEEIKTLIENHIANNKETLEILRQAAKIKHCRYPVDFKLGVKTVVPHISENKECTRLVSLKALLDSESGRGDQVVEDIELGIAIGRSLEEEPTLISQLVRMRCLRLSTQSAECAVNRVELDDNQLESLMRLFAEAEKTDRVLKGMAGERPQIIDFLKHPSDFSGLTGYNPAVLRLYSASGLNKNGLLEYLEFMEANISALRDPIYQRGASIISTYDQIENLPWFHGIVKYFTFEPWRIVFEEVKSVAYLRVCRAGLAVERYRLAEGKLPESLDQVAPRFIDSIPLDPYDGKPIRYKKLDKGFVVYSLGKDGVDNGGLERTKENREQEHDITFIVERNKSD